MADPNLGGDPRDEITYPLIVGGQLSLVVAANAFAITHARAEEIYNASKSAAPEVYASFTFQTWLMFPVNQGLLSVTRDRIQITPLGRDFLHYQVANGMTNPKPG